MPQPGQSLDGSYRRVHDLIPSVSSYVERDRELREDIERVRELIRSGSLVAMVEDTPRD